MKSLIDDILNLSKISRQEMKKQQTNLSQIAFSIISELQASSHSGLSKLTFRTMLLQMLIKTSSGSLFQFNRECLEIYRKDFRSDESNGQIKRKIIIHEG